jgi:translation initiation factor 2B subunit (eIF-2B alpha/beta/delta family)
VWNASLEALASGRSPDRFERFAQRVARSAHALRRFALECFAVDAASVSKEDLESDVPQLRLVTLSFSSSVVTVIEALAAQRQVAVSCSESRPALEGRRLAAALSADGLHVTYFGDGAIGHALSEADAVLLGADAIGPEWFMNKSGTRMLGAAASSQGVPVYLAATRDKFVTRSLASHLKCRDGATAEVWDAPPSGVTVRNPYFEATPLDLVTAVISDVGVLGAAVVPDVCESANDPLLTEALNQLGGVAG